jgi:hypothetical protein
VFSEIVIKSATGNTPGHQILYLKLAKTGRRCALRRSPSLPGRARLDRVPTFEFNREQTRATRVAIEAGLPTCESHWCHPTDRSRFQSLPSVAKFRPGFFI